MFLSVFLDQPFIEFLEALDLQKLVFRLRGVAKTRKSPFSKKVSNAIDLGSQIWCVLEVFGLTWATLGPTFEHVFAQLRFNTVFSEIWCPRPPPNKSLRQRRGTPVGMRENIHFTEKVSKPCGRGADYVKMLLCMPWVSLKFLYRTCTEPVQSGPYTPAWAYI